MCFWLFCQWKCDPFVVHCKGWGILDCLSVKDFIFVSLLVDSVNGCVFNNVGSG